MMDQKAKFTPRGIKAEFVGEEQTDSDAIKAVISGAFQRVYISPESFLANSVSEHAYVIKIQGGIGSFCCG